MSEQMEVLNPYAVAPAQGMSMMDAPRHDSGNVAAANTEAAAIASVKAQVVMAKQFPRDPSLSAERILTECQRPSLADAATYSFPRGNETVSGPSIRLAEVLARNWGNMKFGYEVLDRRPSIGKTPGSSVIRAYAWDLETNVFIDRQFELKHWRARKGGPGYPITDDRDIYELEANMSARRVRACILQIIPGDVTQAAVMACRKTASSGVSALMSDPAKRAQLIQQMIRIFAKMGVTLEDLEAFLSCKSADWTADHMVRLKEIKTALEDNTVSLGDYFPRLATDNQNATVSREQVKQLMEAAKATGMQGRISDELKKLGISKMADIPANKFDEAMALIQSFGEPAEEPKQIESNDSQQQGDQ